MSGRNSLTHSVVLLLSFLTIGAYSATVFRFDNFCDQDHLNTLGDAVKDGVAFQISPGANDVTGSIFVDSPVVVMNGFTSTFVFSITDVQGGGADGFAFVIQTVADRLIGNDAAGIGYGGMKQAVILEFDTFQNTEYQDPNANHISLHYAGDPGTAVTPDEVDFGHFKLVQTNFKDGKQHTVVVSWTPGNNQYTVTIDAETFSWTVDLSKSLVPMNGMAYVGFTASAGGRYEAHNLHSWSFDSTLVTACLAGFDSTNGCRPVPSKQDCTVFSACQSCVSAISCCGWCGNRCAPASDATCPTPAYVCPSGSSSNSVVWWGIGIVIAVLILCAIALFIYWRRTRVKRRIADPTLLPSDEQNQSADSQYAQL